MELALYCAYSNNSIHIVIVVVHSLVVVVVVVVVAVDVGENTWNYINVVTLGGLGLENFMH